MRLSSLIGLPRILWRDLIMFLSDATMSFDDVMAAYFFVDTAYQHTWSKLEVHRTLLKDEVRMQAFEKAIGEAVKPGATVIDVGTGTGILAFMAARAGAGKVVGVDSASIIEVARKAAQRNGFKNVEFVRADLRDVYGPKADLIICELIGMFITDEGITYKMAKMLPLLKEGGKVMPERLDIYVVPVESKDAGLGFWGDIHGIDYSAVGRVPREMRNYDMSAARFLSPPQKAAAVELANPEKGGLGFEGVFEISSDGEFHGCVMYFEAKLSEGVTLSTDPRKPQTHWKQVFLPSGGRMALKRGDRLKVSVKSALNDTKWLWKYSVG
jgi:type I protein arginine methyltransferase